MCSLDAGLQCGCLQSGSLQSGGLQSRGTDFGARDVFANTNGLPIQMIELSSLKPTFAHMGGQPTKMLKLRRADARTAPFCSFRNYLRKNLRACNSLLEAALKPLRCHLEATSKPLRRHSEATWLKIVRNRSETPRLYTNPGFEVTGA